MILSIFPKIVLSLQTLPLKTHLLIQSNRSVIISNNSQFDPMHLSCSRQRDALIHQGRTQACVPSSSNFGPALVQDQTSTVEPLLPSSTIVRSFTNRRYSSGCSVWIGIRRFGLTWAIVSRNSVGIM